LRNSQFQKETWAQDFFVLVRSLAQNKESGMDTIKFAIEETTEEETISRFPTINIYINEQNLIDLVTRVEKNDWDGSRRTRSGYIGFELGRFAWFRNSILGKIEYPRQVLLTCTCTFAECNSLIATITFEEQTVVWSDLKSPFLNGKTPSPLIDEEEDRELEWEPIDYSGLGPFVFDRKQYLSALEDITQESREQGRNLSIFGRS
jgi:hypothetical protein